MSDLSKMNGLPNMNTNMNSLINPMLMNMNNMSGMSGMSGLSGMSGMD